MEAARHLRAVDAQTGEVAEDVDVQALIWEIEQLKADLENAERDLRSKRALIKRLQTDAEKERRAYAGREAVERLFDYWREACRHPNSKLTADRFDSVRAALERGYTEEQIRRAIDGAAFDPFITRRRNGTAKRHDDIELICRDGKRLEEFACKAPASGAKRTRPEVVIRWLDGETWGVVPRLIDP
jgi:hypothetical protein